MNWQDRALTHSVELDSVERRTLDAVHWDAVARYSFYRRRGHPHSDAFLYAYAWGTNAAEQPERRNDHLTGAERKT